MMGQITIDQSHQVMATLAINSDWSEVDFEASGLQDLIVRNPKEAGRQFTAFLKNGGRMPTPTFLTWNTVKLGTHPNTNSLKKAFENIGIPIKHWACNIMSKSEFTLASEETTIELVVATVAELGFTRSVHYHEICARIRELGYDLCSPEVGPQLCLQYCEQLNGEGLHITMEPIADSNTILKIFYIKRITDVSWLSSSSVSPSNFWSLDYRFVFVRPASK